MTTYNKTLFVTDMLGKEELESVFLTKFVSLNSARDGKKYLNVVLTDSTGDLEARMWNATDDMAAKVSKNDFVKVRGKVNFFQGKKQFILSEIEKISNNEIKQEDFIMKSAENPEVMYKALLDIVYKLDDVYIKELLTNILTDQEISRRLKTWQAGKTIHHAYQSGLLEHILSCSELAVSLSKHYRANHNYVVAGAILHDMCKIYELSDGLSVEYTEEGKLVGHLVKGVELIDKYTYKIKNFPHNMKMHLKHILLSHHGEYEYGSPKIPHTSEAFLVHLIDMMDSKMNSMEMVKRLDTTPGHWSGFVKHLDRIVFKDELPYYPEHIDETKPEEVRTEKKTSKPSTEVKTNLGKLLSNYGKE